MVTDPCGTCRRAGESVIFYCSYSVYSCTVAKANYEAGFVDHDRELAAQRRHVNLDAKMRKTPIDAVHRPIGTMVPIQELQAVRTAQGIGYTSQQSIMFWTVYFECRRSDSPKNVDQMLGTGVISFPEGHTMLGMSCLRIICNFSL